MRDESREARREATRRAIEDAAIALFLERGFEGVDVAEVARSAGVSRRTFFRHFRQKSDVVFGKDREHEISLRGLIRSRPTRELSTHAVAWTMVAFAEWVESERPRMLGRSRLILGNRDLIQHALFIHATWTEALAQELAMRAGRARPDIEDRMLGAWGVAAHEIAVLYWAEEGGQTPLSELTRVALTTRIRPPSALH
jgi:AcrR family transcriptional regulator